MRQKYYLNTDWLISGEGPMRLDESGGAAAVVPIDAAMQVLQEAEAEAGATLNQAQRLAVLKIMRRYLAEDKRQIQELITALLEGNET